MKKSALIKEINEVIEKNGVLFTKCRELETAINEKDTLIESLRSEIGSLTAENERLKEFEAIYSESKVADAFVSDIEKTVCNDATSENMTDNNMTDNLDTESEETSETETDKLCDADCEPEEFIELSIDTVDCPLDQALPEDALKSASEAIGRVVVKSAELCNAFAAAGNQNSKDLINLALGRTEVFKSEVLSLVSSEEMSKERFEAELRSREAAVNEYFELLSRQ